MLQNKLLISAAFMKTSIQPIKHTFGCKRQVNLPVKIHIVSSSQVSEELLRVPGSIVQRYLKQIRLSINIHCHTCILPIATALPAAPAAVLAVRIAGTFAPFIIV